MKSARLFMATVLCAACVSTPEPAQPVVGAVTLEVSGGIAGWDRIVTVDPDGTVHVQAVSGPTPSPTTEKLDPDVLRRLHELVSDPAFAQLGPAYLPPQPGADLQDYRVTAVVDGKTLKTMARQGSYPPPILREVLDIMRGIAGIG
jgi:hypothetical protein